MSGRSHTKSRRCPNCDGWHTSNKANRCRGFVRSDDLGFYCEEENPKRPTGRNFLGYLLYFYRWEDLDS